jgi:hypothetical protein
MFHLIILRLACRRAAIPGGDGKFGSFLELDRIPTNRGIISFAANRGPHTLNASNERSFRNNRNSFPHRGELKGIPSRLHTRP